MPELLAVALIVSVEPPRLDSDYTIPMASGVGPWWSKTWWGKRNDAISVTLTIVILAFCLWKAFFP